MDRRSIQYISIEKTQKDEALQAHISHLKDIMVWIGISHHSCTRPIFVESGAKINGTYSQEKILKKIIPEMKCLYPEKRPMFHQDSAPSHADESTINWLRRNKIKFVHPNNWLPPSLDVATCDYFLWGYLKNR